MAAVNSSEMDALFSIVVYTLAKNNFIVYLQITALLSARYYFLKVVTLFNVAVTQKPFRLFRLRSVDEACFYRQKSCMCI
jgi:hypothetical protein